MSLDLEWVVYSICYDMEIWFIIVRNPFKYFIRIY
jgi:hypothetical protein